MVVNDRFRFIFVHVPKAAGTSVMCALDGLPGNNTRLLAETKHERLADFYEAWPKRKATADTTLSSAKSYFVFGFVRNPWDRMSSLYRYLTEQRPRSEIDSVTSFRDFLCQARFGETWIRGLHSMSSQVDFFRLRDGSLRADFLGHFEHLRQDLECVAETLRIRCEIAHENSSSNGRGDYRQDYTDEMIEIVAELFAADIEAFGYRFDTPRPQRRLSRAVNVADACPRITGAKHDETTWSRRSA